MGGGAMMSPVTSPPSLSSICNIPFEESWTKCRCIDNESSSKILDIESSDQKGTIGSPYDSAFGSVPSSWEVEKAMSDLQSFMSGCHARKEEMNWFNTIQDPHQSTLQQSPGYARLYDAFHMLQNEPAAQRLVLSIARDEAVWEAVMNNKAVQDLQGSLICSDQYKAINDEGMPSYGRPFIKGRLYIHFNVEFPESGVLSPDTCRVIETVLPPKPGKRSSAMELDESEETTMHDVNIEEELRRREQQRQQEAYDSEDDEPNVHRVACNQQ